MKLRTRLVIAFLAVLVIPLALGRFMLAVITNYQCSVLEKTYGVSDDFSMLSGTSFRILAKITIDLSQNIIEVVNDNPDQLLDQDYVTALNAKCMEKNAWLLVERNGEYVFVGDSSFDKETLEEMTMVSTDEKNAYGYLENGGQLSKKLTFRYNDGSQGVAYIFASINEQLPEMKLLVVEMVIIIVMVLVLTASFLVFWIHRSVVRPINRLREATQQVRDGNLDFTLEAGKDEIGQLCTDFDEMRIRLKESTEEKIQYDQDNKELISNISHDLKTPITAIKGYVEGIMDGVADTPEKVNKYLKTVYNKANDMTRLIDELTYYSKIDTNRIPYAFTKLDVSEYFKDCADEMGLELESQNIEFGYFNYIPEGTIVIADPEQMRKVINNIVSNSVKYMDKDKGKINIRLKDDGDFIQISIEDNGKGIATKDLVNIFDRFYRTDSSRNSAKGGSGIGLSIVKKIIDDHGGRIWATSKEGTGTEMHIVLRKYQENISEDVNETPDPKGKSDAKAVKAAKAANKRANK